MSLALQILFWISLFLVFWTYAGYLLTLKLLSLICTKRVNRDDDYTPPVSLIITAYNEELRIAEKIENTLVLDYPPDKLDVIVVSDGSTDETDSIVRSYADRGVRLLAIDERHGKHYGQGRGIRLSECDVVVLTDATTFLAPDAVRKIVRNFADPSVGCVSGMDRMRSDASSTTGEGLYVRYEMELRRLESAVGSLVGVSGCFFAVRRHLCKDWIDNMSSDFYMPSVTKLHGYRTVLEPEAAGFYEVVADVGKEFVRKTRTVVHGLEVLFRFRAVMNPFRHGLYALQMLSHKLCRWLVPILLASALVANIVLLNDGWLYRVTLGGQVGFYALALLGQIVSPLRSLSLFKVPHFFVMVNWSIVVAWFKYLTRQEYVVWDATKR